MTVAELLKAVVDGSTTEAQFMEQFSILFRGQGQISDAEAECLSKFVEDVNMAEHCGSLFDVDFMGKVEECSRLLSAGASASEIRDFFNEHRSQ